MRLGSTKIVLCSNWIVINNFDNSLSGKHHKFFAGISLLGEGCLEIWRIAYFRSVCAYPERLGDRARRASVFWALAALFFEENLLEREEGGGHGRVNRHAPANNGDLFGVSLKRAFLTLGDEGRR
jgi:hypothetical protein